jgi:hypothetical protein
VKIIDGENSLKMNTIDLTKYITRPLTRLTSKNKSSVFLLRSLLSRRTFHTLQILHLVLMVSVFHI